jgi:hypothetical protein
MRGVRQGRERGGQTRMLVLALAAGAIIPAGCAGPGPAPGEPTWLGATNEATQRVVARQLRGLDVAMIELDHRYTELYFAGQDRNWAYAEHQVEHMELALDLALERRPLRAANARAIFYPALERMEAAIEAADPDAFGSAFDGLRLACNACHAAEGEGYMVVDVPTRRRTNIRGPGPDAQTP